MRRHIHHGSRAEPGLRIDETPPARKGPGGQVDDRFLIQSGREIRTMEDWLLLAGPKEGIAQWAHGRSAMETARAWLRGGRPAVPKELSALLESCEQTANFRPLYAIPELVTKLDEFRGEHRNHDLVVVGIARGGRTLLGIEAKADEPFGSMRTGVYLEKSSRKPRSNAPERIRRLVRALFGPSALNSDQVVEPYASLRYQLLTALAGTLIEGRRRFAEQAILLVHEFTSASVQELGYAGTKGAALARNDEDWRALVSALGASAARESAHLAGPLRVPGSDLIPPEMPFFLGKAGVDLRDNPALRQSAERGAPPAVTEAVPPPSQAGGAEINTARLQAEGFSGFVSFDQLQSGELERVPQGAGIYVVVREDRSRPTFMQSSSGGHFKGRDPTELVEVLDAKWVDGAAIVYVGKGDSLRRRLKQYCAFGAGRPVGHWGGRYIWQLADDDALVVGWRACDAGETAAEAEAALVRRFKEAFGRLPFANIADPSRA
jgi:hypothetical protein